MKDIQFDKMKAIPFEDKFIISLPKRITELVGKKIEGHLAIQNNRIIWLGPKVSAQVQPDETPNRTKEASIVR